MCGLSGFTGKNEEQVREMNTRLHHRGPDAAGIFVADGVSLGHTLLAFTDVPQNSGQPVVSPDRSQALIYNGEIYNYKKLREKLKAHGDRFETDSDTEVVFKGITRFGKDFLAELDGMFALAWYDARTQTILLARDTAGIKPLYFYYKDGVFIFCSELRGILAHENVVRRLDTAAMELFFQLGYVPGPRTLIQNISKLCPGQSLTYSLARKTFVTQWFGDRTPEPKPETFDPDYLRTIIGESVQSHTMGLRPFGLYLSGGLDSTSLLHELSVRNDQRIRTYTTRFDVPDDQYNDDALTARRLCNDYGIDHHELLVTERDFMGAYAQAIEAIEEPRYNPSIAAYWLLAQEAKKDITVVLSGSGGDELFFGYPKYLQSRKITDRFKKYPAVVVNAWYALNAIRYKRNRFPHWLKLQDPLARWAFLNVIGPTSNAWARWDRSLDLFGMTKYLASIDAPAVREPLADTENAIAEYDRLFWLADEEFLRADKILMHFSLEGRFPLLAKSIVDYANRIPSPDKIRDGRLKAMMRIAYTNHLPDYIVNKPKTGWKAPVSLWMQTQFGNEVRSVLEPGYYPATASLFDFDYIRKEYLDAPKKFTTAHLKNFLPIVSFQIWARTFNIEL